MKKIIYRKLLTDCVFFSFLFLLSLSIIIWVFQAVNYLDIMIEDGRDYLIYFHFTLLNLPKIISKIYPFAIFFGFIYVLSKYELNNELVIFWNIGISKINLINFLLFWSFILLMFQIILTSFVVPKTQDLARSLLRSSNVNMVGNFLKTKNFNDNIKGLTIYIEGKDFEKNLRNIYLKKQITEKNFQITYAKKGYFKNNKFSSTLVLIDGETLSFTNNNLTKFSFSKTDYSLDNLQSNSTTYIKTQENPTYDLIMCVFFLLDTSSKKISEINFRKENCSKENLNNIYAEIYKRLIIPFYIPVLILISLMLITVSKEKVIYSKFRYLIFFIGLACIIFSETTLRLINSLIIHNIKVSSIPFAAIISIYIYYFYKFNSIKFDK